MVEVRAFVFRWQRACWKCKVETPVLYALRPPTNRKHIEFSEVYHYLAGGESNYVTPEEDLEMGAALSNRYRWYRRGYANAYFSWCVSCRFSQGPQFVHILKELHQIRSQMDLYPHTSATNWAYREEYVDYDTSIDGEERWEQRRERVRLKREKVRDSRGQFQCSGTVWDYSIFSTVMGDDYPSRGGRRRCDKGVKEDGAYCYHHKGHQPYRDSS